MYKKISPFFLSLIFLFVAIILGISVGAVPIPFRQVSGILFDQLPLLGIPSFWPETSETILLSIRLPRVALVVLTGSALGGSGAAYQGLFRNPLADPYLIGVASGAGLGAVIAMTFKWPANLLGMLVIPAAAFLGAVCTILVVYSLAKVGKSAPVTTLILAGVAVSAFASSLTTFLMLRSDGELHRAISWMVGGFSLGGWLPVLALLPYVVLGVGFIIIMGRPLNVLQFGDEQATQMGLNVEHVKLVIIIAASLTTAAAVSFSGIIGFVGLAIPHLVRLLWGTDYRVVTPLAVIVGAGMLVLADCIARTVIAPEELPVGVITALAGAPFFLWLLRRSKQQALW